MYQSVNYQSNLHLLPAEGGHSCWRGNSGCPDPQLSRWPSGRHPRLNRSEALARSSPSCSRLWPLPPAWKSFEGGCNVYWMSHFEKSNQQNASITKILYNQAVHWWFLGRRLKGFASETWRGLVYDANLRPIVRESNFTPTELACFPIILVTIRLWWPLMHTD